jgi:hypothetical protein
MKPDRKFKPTTRPLNRRKLRELMLDKYEDSLYAPRHRQSKKRKPQKPAARVEAEQTDKQRRELKRTKHKQHDRTAHIAV